MIAGKFRRGNGFVLFQGQTRHALLSYFPAWIDRCFAKYQGGGHGWDQVLVNACGGDQEKAVKTIFQGSQSIPPVRKRSLIKAFTSSAS